MLKENSLKTYLPEDTIFQTRAVRKILSLCDLRGIECIGDSILGGDGLKRLLQRKLFYIFVPKKVHFRHLRNYFLMLF